MFRLANIGVREYLTGTDNMDVTFDPKIGSGGLYVPSVLIGLWVHFEDIKTGGGGISINKLEVGIKSYNDLEINRYNVCLRSEDKTGIETGPIGRDFVLTVTSQYAHKYYLEVDPKDPNRFDRISVKWTNLDTGNVSWGVTAAIVTVESFDGEQVRTPFLT